MKKKKINIRTGHWIKPSKSHSEKVKYTKKQIRRNIRKEINEDN